MNEVLATIKNLFVAVADREEITEQKRQVLAAMDNFEAASTFAHIDADSKGYVTSQELTAFMKNNGVEDVSEEVMEIVVKFFDSME